MKDKYIAAFAVVTVITLIRQHRRMRTIANVLCRVTNVLNEVIDMGYQKEVDEVFENIVNDYE